MGLLPWRLGDCIAKQFYALKTENARKICIYQNFVVSLLKIFETMTKIKKDRRNYRVHNDENKRVIRKSLEELGAGRSIVIDNEGEIIAGNGVYEQAQKLGIKTKIVETDGSELVVVKRTDLATCDDKRKKLALADNAASDTSEWAYELLREDWTPDVLSDFGVVLPDVEVPEEMREKEKDEYVEGLLNAAMVQYIAEYVQIFDYCMKADFGSFLPDGRSVGYAKLQYIKAKYYGEKYDGKNSYIFTPQQYFVKARNGQSYYDAMKCIITGKKAGIAGFRTSTDDGNLNKMIGNQYRLASASAAADFPPMKAREIFRTYYKGGRVLDPCHGWGGRLVGAMLADVEEYVGVDPSPDAHAGVSKIYEAFKEYQETKVTLIQKPFEDCDWKDGEFDFALTCPPYFDVEKYSGEDTSTKRYPKFEQWCKYFYEPLIVNTMNALKKDGVFALIVGSQLYPLADKAKEICTSHGYKIQRCDDKIFANNMHGTDDEKIDSLFLISKQ